METIWSIKDCQLQRNEDILNLEKWCKNNYYQSKFSKEWHSLKKNSAAQNISIIFAILWNFSKPFAILLKFYNTFWNIFEILQYFLQYFESIAIPFAIIFAIFGKFAILWDFSIPKYCNTIAIQYYWNHPWLWYS